MAREWDRARLAAGANLTGREQRHAQLLFGRLADRRSRIALVEHLIEAQPAHRHFGATAQARVMRRHALVPDAQERIEVDRLAAIVLGLRVGPVAGIRSEEHTSELQSLMRNSYAVFCLKKKQKHTHKIKRHQSSPYSDTRIQSSPI